MKYQGTTKDLPTERTHTSRGQVDSILKMEDFVTIETLQRGAARVGRELRLELA